MPIAAVKEMKGKRRIKRKPEVVIPKGYTIDEWCDSDNDYIEEQAIKTEEVRIRFER